MLPALQALADSPGFRGVITAEEVRRLGLALPELLPLAARYARPPVSRFSVGAVAQGLSGAVYLGANIEFPGQPLNASVHAEQSAVANAWVHGERGLSALAVTAAPCGHCRQFLHELASPPAILLPGRDALPLSTLLPDAFGPGDLGIPDRLMQPADHGLTIDADDPLLRAALEAANASHAPYSRAWAGVALRTADGAVFAGRYAENAAFNPSLPPLQCAVALLLLAGRRLEEVTAAALVEHPSPVSHAGAARALLAPLGIPVTAALAHPLQS